MNTQSDIPGQLKLLMPPEEIHLIVERLSQEIRQEYGAKNPVFVSVMKGAMVFTADLIRAARLPLEVDFVQMSSYGNSITPAPDAVMARNTCLDLRDRHVLVVDTMVDRGVTVSTLIGHLSQRAPASVKICALLSRKQRCLTGQPKIDFIGTRVDDGFVVGYGLDYKERYRHLPGLYMLDNTEK